MSQTRPLNTQISGTSASAMDFCHLASRNRLAGSKTDEAVSSLPARIGGTNSELCSAAIAVLSMIADLGVKASFKLRNTRLLKSPAPDPTPWACPGEQTGTSALRCVRLGAVTPLRAGPSCSLPGQAQKLTAAGSPFRCRSG